jgi:hypothetical protein
MLIKFLFKIWIRTKLAAPGVQGDQRQLLYFNIY